MSPNSNCGDTVNPIIPDSHPFALWLWLSRDFGHHANSKSIKVQIFLSQTVEMLCWVKNASLVTIPRHFPNSRKTKTKTHPCAFLCLALSECCPSSLLKGAGSLLRKASVAVHLSVSVLAESHYFLTSGSCLWTCSKISLEKRTKTTTQHTATPSPGRPLLYSNKSTFKMRPETSYNRNRYKYIVCASNKDSTNVCLVICEHNNLLFCV